MKDLTHEVQLRVIVNQHTTDGLVNGWEVAKASYKLAFRDKPYLEAEVRYLRNLITRLSGLTGKTGMNDQPLNQIGHGVIVTSGGQLDVDKLLDRIARIEHSVSRSIDDGR